MYRKAARGAITWQDVGAAARVLREIRQCLESSDVELRLARLEAIAPPEPPWPGEKSAHGPLIN
jgi:hypothetical protein